MSEQQRVIIVDWGAKSFRAWLVDLQADEVLAEIPEGRGMRDLARSEFPGYCRAVLSRWRDDPSQTRPPVYMAGMVGSVLGWLTAPQPPLPQGPDDLAEHVVPVEDMRDTWIVPGVRLEGDQDRVDVMRGEEVQIFGALDAVGCKDATLCLPGNHSKWAEVKNGRLIRFTTCMTGEIYQTCLDHTILGQPADRKAPWSDSAFQRGLAQSARPDGLLHHMFTARSRHLYGDLGGGEIAPFLSGVLIGHEVRAMEASYQPAQEILLVSADALRAPYEAALTACGHTPRWVSAKEATQRGVRAVVAKHQKRLAEEDARG